MQIVASKSKELVLQNARMSDLETLLSESNRQKMDLPAAIPVVPVTSSPQVETSNIEEENRMVSLA